MRDSYQDVEALLVPIQGNGARCLALLRAHRDRMCVARGSSHNHQAWEGGYLGHVSEVMRIALVLYDSLSSYRPLPFVLSDALIVLFLHDIEKPWKVDHDFRSKADRHAFREKLIAEYGIVLTDAQRNALRYVEGEGDDYRSDRRVMGELAAFCHMCDVASARIWWDAPIPLASRAAP